jgi:hypothetical protein
MELYSALSIIRLLGWAQSPGRMAPSKQAWASCSDATRPLPPHQTSFQVQESVPGTQLGRATSPL